MTAHSKPPNLLPRALAILCPLQGVEGLVQLTYPDLTDVIVNFLLSDIIMIVYDKRTSQYSRSLVFIPV